MSDESEKPSDAEPSAPHNDSSNPNHKAINAAAEKIIAALTRINRANRKADAAEHKRTDSREKRRFVIEKIEIALIAVYAFVTVFEWQTFNNESMTMKNEFLAGQTNATQQLTVLQGQLDEMRKDRNLDERAWIDPYQVTRWSDNEFSNSWYIILHYKNIGKTPALRTQVAIGVTTNLDSIPVLTENMIDFSIQNLFPNDASEVKSSEMPIGLFADAWNEQIPIYIYGIISYDDIFRKRHWIRFRWVNDLRTGEQYPAYTGNECDTNN